MNVTVSDEHPSSLTATIVCDCGRTILFRPNPGITVNQLFLSADLGRAACECQRALTDREIARLRDVVEP